MTNAFGRRSATADPQNAANSVIDQSVGTCLRLRRLTLGYSQLELARKVGLSTDQLQRYEDGRERVSAAALHCLAKALQVPASWFFSAQLDRRELQDQQADALAEQEDRISLIDETNEYLTEVIELVKTFLFVDDQPRRSELAAMLRAIASELDRKL